MTDFNNDHYDGKRFHNCFPPQSDRSLKDVLIWLSQRKTPSRPENIDIEHAKVAIERNHSETLHATFINHSTVLIQFNGLNILTDPIWSDRCSPLPFLGPKRIASPGMAFEDLPPIDIVLISHSHYDHTDLPTLRKLSRNHKPLFCVPRGLGVWLQKKGIANSKEFDWWQEEKIDSKLKISFVPAQHFSNRGIFDHNKTLWGGFVLIEVKPYVYFAGDTGYGTHFKAIREKYGPPRLALLPIGAYLPRWFMQSVHMSPEDAVKAHIDLQAFSSMAIHYGTFMLGDENYEDPVIDLKVALEKYNIPLLKFLAIAHGESIVL